MQLYCIRFYRQYEDDNTEHDFFVYALNEKEAKQRFCITSGSKGSCIVSVNVLKGK